MKRRFLVILAVVTLLLFVITEVAMAVHIRGIYYDFNAAENEPALRVDWSGRKPDYHRMAGDFQLKGSIQTIADLEADIQSEIDDVILKVESINDYPEDDPVRADPPILTDRQEIIGNKVYTHTMYFKIHIYDLSPLNFLTRFSTTEIPDNWWPPQ